MDRDRGRCRHARPGSALRQPRRRAAIESPARRRRSGGIRIVLPRRACSRRRIAQVRRVDPDRQEALPASAAAQRALGSPRDRCADTRRASSFCARPRATSQSSLLAAIDRTVTGPGARELAARLAEPSARFRCDRRRGSMPSASCTETRRCAGISGAPCGTRPIWRARCRGSPCSAAHRSDLGAVRDGLAAAAVLCAPAARAGAAASACPTALAGICARLAGCAADLQPLLARALVDDPPHLRRDGDFVRPGFSAPISTTPARSATRAVR